MGAMLDQKLRECLTFDDVLLVPAYSDVLPSEVGLEARLTRALSMPMPLLSSAMDSVTESETAITMAREGGIGVIHKNLAPADQAREVALVKSAEVRPGSHVDAHGRLRVAAAIGPSRDRDERAAALLEAGCDVLVVDTAHGHSRGVIEAVQALRKAYPQAQIIAGNVATAEGTLALIEAGVDAVKTGIGPGSICTTRVVEGIGVPQISAIADCAEVAEKYGIPIVADGGIKYSGEVTKAIAAGASSVMIGSLFAGTDEAPGEIVERDSRAYKVYRGMGSLGAMRKGSKDRYGQGAISDEKLVPEGIEGQVPHRGPLGPIIQQLLGGLRAGMGYTGSRGIDELRQKARFVRITAAGLRESHVHDVIMTVDAPNYRR
jgi:IMP dehydrogenase